MFVERRKGGRDRGEREGHLSVALCFMFLHITVHRLDSLGKKARFHGKPREEVSFETSCGGLSAQEAPRPLHPPASSRGRLWGGWGRGQEAGQDTLSPVY